MSQNVSNLQKETTPIYTKKVSISQEKEYLKKFHQFLEQKLNRPSIKKQNSVLNSPNQNTKTKRLLTSHLNKKRLAQNSSQNRINKIMDEFKSLDTYVNIKNFIREINSINFSVPKQQSTVETHQVFENQNRIVQSSQFQKVYANIFQKANIYAGNQINKNIIKSSEFINRFTKSLNSSHLWIDENCEQNIFESLFLNQMLNIEDENHYKLNHQDDNFLLLQRKLRYQQSKKQQIPKKTHQQQTPIQVNEKYYEDFKRKATDIQSKLHQMLQNMHIQKWKNRQKQLSNKKKQIKIKKIFFSNNNIKDQNKPVLNIKYKLYAPKHIFNFKKDNQQYITQRDKWSRRRNGKILLDNSVNNKQNSNYKQAILPVLKQQQKKFRKTKSNSRSKVCKNMILNQINDIKQKYNFKNPLVKQNILRKIMEFISDVQDKQYGFKKKNAQLFKSINKFQQNKKLDFDKFLDENLEIDTKEFKNIGLNIKKIK